MSYILEALKKADRDRLVGNVPDLEAVHAVGPPPRSARRWYWLLGMLLLINGLLVTALMLRDDTAGEPGGDMTGTATTPAPAPAQTRLPEATPVKPVPAQAAPASQELPWKAYYQPPARQAETPSSPSTATLPAAAPAKQGAGSVVYMDEPLSGETEPATDTSPVKSAVPPPVLGATGQASQQAVERSESVLPDWDDLPLEFRSGFQVPHIDVHVYDTDPAQRFILVNLIKYRPGDRLESGALLEQITPDGVQLLFHGKRFIYRP